jgi:hypothetical protein
MTEPSCTVAAIISSSLEAPQNPLRSSPCPLFSCRRPTSPLEPVASAVVAPRPAPTPNLASVASLHHPTREIKKIEWQGLKRRKEELHGRRRNVEEEWRKERKKKGRKENKMGEMTKLTPGIFKSKTARGILGKLKRKWAWAQLIFAPKTIHAQLLGTLKAQFQAQSEWASRRIQNPSEMGTRHIQNQV